MQGQALWSAFPQLPHPLPSLHQPAVSCILAWHRSPEQERCLHQLTGLAHLRATWHPVPGGDLVSATATAHGDMQADGQRVLALPRALPRTDIWYHEKWKDPCALVRMVGSLCLGKTEGWESGGGKGQPCCGAAGMQSSPTRGWEEIWGAERPRGYGESRGIRGRQRVPEPKQCWQSPWCWGALGELQKTRRARAQWAGLDMEGPDCAPRLTHERGRGMR